VGNRIEFDEIKQLGSKALPGEVQTVTPYDLFRLRKDPSIAYIPCA